jgi:hypothetical protein
MAAVIAIATAITRADKRQGLLKTIGRNLRQAVVDGLSPVIEEVRSRGHKKKTAKAK